MSRAFALGAARTMLSEAIGRGAAIGFQMLVANQLGASRFAIVVFALSTAATLSPLADAGLPNLAMQLVSQYPDDDTLVGRLLGLKVLLTPVYVLPLFIWVICFPFDGDKTWPMLWAGAFYGFQAASDLLRQVLRSREATQQELSARMILPFANLAALFLVWKLKPGPSGALLALASGPTALTLSYLWRLPRRVFRMELVTSLWELLASHWPSVSQSVFYLLMAGFVTRMDTFVLEAYSTPYHLGRFSAVAGMVLAGMFFGQGMVSYLYPRLHRQTSGRRRALLRAVCIQGSLGISLGSGAILLGPSVFRLIFRDPSFKDADALINGFAGILLLATLDSLWLSILVGSRKLWIAALNLVPTLLLKVFLGRFLVLSHGEFGMLLASIAAYLCSVTLDAVFAVRLYLRPPHPESTIPEPDL